VRSAQATLEVGVAILREVMDSHSFIWMMKTAGEGSGGAFASGEFQRRSLINSEPPRSLELHLRYSLGMVMYRIGPLSLSHVDYMLAVTGRNSATPLF
jgi:hypothetical protein